MSPPPSRLKKKPSYLLQGGFLLGLFFDPEGEGDVFL
jgi:hypothetical protein